MTSAAAELRLSQPALTQSITKLETWIGDKLLERERGGSFVTPSGYTFARRVGRFFSQLEFAILEPIGGGPIVDAVHSAAMLAKLRSIHIQVLIAVAASASFEEAARRLGIQRPVLQRVARELEQILRRQLYDRRGLGFTTSAHGLELARRWRIALREIEYGVEEIFAQKGRVGSRIVIGSMHLVSATLLARALNNVASEFPHARFQIVEMRYGELLNALRNGDIDLAYGMLRAPSGYNDIVEEILFHDPYVIVVRRGHPLSNANKKLTLRDLMAYEWIMPAAGGLRSQSFDQLFAGVRKPPLVRIETTSVKMQKELIVSSDRITLFTRSEMMKDENQIRLISLPSVHRIPKNADGLITRAGWLPTPIQLRLLMLLREYSSSEGKASEKSVTGSAPTDWSILNVS